MKPFYRDLRLSLIVAIMAFAVCWASNHWLLSHENGAEQPKMHEWLHEQLHITHEQDQKLLIIEQPFAVRTQELEQRIRDGNKELSQAIIEDGKYSPRVTAVADRIHAAQGELQKVTLEHLFKMQSVLTPEQKDKLNKLAADALQHNP